MSDFKNKEVGNVWHIHNTEHLKHFRQNPKFEEIVKEEVKNNKTKKKTKKISQEVGVNTTILTKREGNLNEKTTSEQSSSNN